MQTEQEKSQLQLGFKIRPLEIQYHSKFGTFEGCISNGLVFEWWVYKDFIHKIVFLKLTAPYSLS